MNDVQRIAALCKRHLLALGLCAGVAAVALGALYYGADLQRQATQATAAALQSQQALVAEQENDLKNVQTHIRRYQQLRDQGLMGEAQRLLWMEQLQQAFAQAGVAQQLRMELQAPQPLAVDPALQDADSQALSHDLAFEIPGVVETEVLAGLAHLRQHARGRFRVHACHFAEAKADGLLARCTLRFITIPTAAPAAGS
ncbi:MAG: hypothetical protein ACT4NV_18925 [Rhodoferax sp.]